jgi:hypothetical protein
MRRRWLDPLLAIVVPVGLIAGLYLAPFVGDPSTMPFGVDTSAYVWRVSFVHDFGIGSLTPESSNSIKPLGDRPGYPVVLSLLRSATGLSSLELAWLTPALMASALGLAAGSLAADGAAERRRRSGGVGVAVAASAFVAWTAVGYATNLALDVVAVAAAVIALEVVRGRRGVLGGALLLAGGALLHWMFAALFVGLLALFAVVQLVRSDEPGVAGSRRSAAWRLATMLVLGVALAAVCLLLLAPESPGRLPGVRPGMPGPTARIDLRLPAMALPVTLPLAAGGIAVLVLSERNTRRSAAVLLGIWSSLPVVALAGWYVLDLPLTPYRWAGFALAIPASIVLGAFAAGDRLELAGKRRLGTVAVSLGLVAAVGLAGAGASVWWSREPSLTTTEFAELGTLASYLRPLPPRTRIVILLDRVRIPPINRARAGLPAGRVPYVTMATARVHPKAPDFGLGPDILDGEPTVVVALDSYLKDRLDTGRLVGPGVHLLVGPDPREVRPGSLPRAPSGLVLVLALVGSLGVLLVVGSGWAALSDLPVLGVVGVAPAFGLATLSVAGLVTSRMGIPLHGLGGIGVIVGVALAGWTAAMLLRPQRDRAAIDRGV